MKFGNEFWLILFREYINPKLFAVQHRTVSPKAAHVATEQTRPGSAQATVDQTRLAIGTAQAVGKTRPGSTVCCMTMPSGQHRFRTNTPRGSSIGYCRKACLKVAQV
jgi:hypothetical protein